MGEKFEFYVSGKCGNWLEKLVDNAYVDNICDKRSCHFVTKATSISKYVVTLERLFFKLQSRSP
jgi:hypothetical protein